MNSIQHLATDRPDPTSQHSRICGAPNLVENITRHYALGATMDQIASLLGVSLATVRRIVRTPGCVPRHAVRDALITRLREQGYTLEAIATTMRLTRQRVHQILGRAKSAPTLPSGVIGTKRNGPIPRAEDGEAPRRHGPRRDRARWSSAAIVAALHEALHHLPGRLLTPKGYDQLVSTGRVTGPSARLITRRLGGWRSACLQAQAMPAA